MLKAENKIFNNLYNDLGWEIESALKREDLPTLDRPKKATSAEVSFGRSSIRVTPSEKVIFCLNNIFLDLASFPVSFLTVIILN